MRNAPVAATFPTSWSFAGLNHRDMVCLGVAIVAHSLLFLWKGGALMLPDHAADSLGDSIVEVRFMNEAPNFEPAGGSSPAPKSFLARMKSIIRGEGGSGPKTEELAMGQQSRIDVAKPAWNKAESTLENKAFADKPGFEGLVSKDDALKVAMGKASDIVVKPSQGNYKAAEPNLKENAFKVATKDAPFKILKPKSDDALSNVNAVPVVVGRTTSAQVKALDGGQGAGPALQSRSFASDGGKPFAGGGAFGSSSRGSSDAGGGQLSTGGAAMAALPAGSGMGTGVGMGSGSGVGNGAGTGSGRGTGVGSGSGSGTGNGSGGRSWGGAGTGSRPLQALRRNSVRDDIPSSIAAASKSGSGFNITGALANRPILDKVHPPYERDARVALRFRVDWSGRVLDGIIIEMSSGVPSFDNKVLQALKEWRFSRLPANRTNEIQEGVITFVFKGV